jgi:hypothetical protein
MKMDASLAGQGTRAGLGQASVDGRNPGRGLAESKSPIPGESVGSLFLKEGL